MRGSALAMVAAALATVLIALTTAQQAATAQPSTTAQSSTTAQPHPPATPLAVVVVADPGVPSAVLPDLQDLANQAWIRVVSIWGSTAVVPRVRLLAGPAALAAAAQPPRSTTAGLVAVTTADQVLVDSTAYLSLAPAGRAVVLAHELTHLATGAAADPEVPVWLEEGFADYVGFTGSSIPVDQAAKAALDRVRAGEPLTGLPSGSAFTAGAPEQAAAYAQSWLMCRWLAQEYGQAALVAIYHRVANGRQSLADAVLRVTGRPLAAAIVGWSRAVSELAR